MISAVVFPFVQERKSVSKQGLVVQRLSGDAIQPHHWDAFHDFYLHTVDKKWGSAYLTKDFFHRCASWTSICKHALHYVGQQNDMNLVYQEDGLAFVKAALIILRRLCLLPRQAWS